MSLAKNVYEDSAEKRSHSSARVQDDGKLTPRSSEHMHLLEHIFAVE